MPNVLEKIVAAKREEIAAVKRTKSIESLRGRCSTLPPPVDFFEAINGGPPIRLIAEVKKASPSKGVIRADFQPTEIALAYQAGGASAISVLTDEQFFQGSLGYLADVAAAVNIPVMRKEFILDPIQIYEARIAGASAVLLIAECLSEVELCDLYNLTRELKMHALIELYDYENLPKVIGTGTKIIGVNNRDLRTFEVDLMHTLNIRNQLPDDVCLVAESGIADRSDVETLQQGGADSMLVGESLMKQTDVKAATKALLGIA